MFSWVPLDLLKSDVSGCEKLWFALDPIPNGYPELGLANNFFIFLIFNFKQVIQMKIAIIIIKKIVDMASYPYLNYQASPQPLYSYAPI